MSVDNIYSDWDLDGLVKLSDLSFSYKDLDIIRNIFLDELKNTEKFSRFAFLNIPYEFTTTEDIYRATGLYKVIYSENSIGKYRRDNYILVGNRNMLDIYSPVFVLLKNYSYYIDDSECDGIKLKNNFLSFAQMYYLYFEEKLIVNDYSIDFNSLYNFNYKIQEHELLKVLKFFKVTELKINSPLIFEYELKDLGDKDLSYLFILADYCNIDIILKDVNKNTHLSDDLKSLLYTCSNINLLNSDDLNPLELGYVGTKFEIQDKSLISDLDMRVNSLLNIKNNF